MASSSMLLYPTGGGTDVACIGTHGGYFSDSSGNEPAGESMPTAKKQGVMSSITGTY